MTNFDEMYIDRYLLNQLTVSEQHEFEQTMKQNAALVKQVEAQKKLIQATKLVKREATKAQVKTNTKNWEQYVDKLAGTSPSKIYGLKQSIQALSEEMQALINQFFRPYSVNFRNTESEIHTLEDKAYNFYSQKDYEQAFGLLEQLPNTNKEAKLMLGNALLIEHQYESAYSHFIQLIEENAIGYVSEAHWYAGLSLLQLNRIEEAKIHFQTISINEYAGKKLKNKALEILKKIVNIAQ